MDSPPSDDRPAGPDAAPDPAPSERAAAPVRTRSGSRFGSPPRRPLLLGLAASLLMVVGGFGAGGVLVHDPVLTNSPLGFWRYGHGSQLAAIMIYSGVALMAWAWVQLGRDVLARRVGGRAVLTTALVWSVPMLFSPPLFTRDVFSYLAQGGLPLAGFDPYEVGPEVMPGVFTENVHYFWQNTPAPYGPLFILIAKSVTALVGDNVILGVVLMRLTMLPGLALLIWALPELTRRLGGRVPLAMWIAVANPVMVIHMIGGGHNDLIVVGMLAAGALIALRGAPASGIAIVSAAMAVKASAGIALPFLVLVWAAQLTGSPRSRLVRGIAYGVGVFVVVFAACTFAAGVSLGWLPALSAPSMIVNWMSIPTAVGEFLHMLTSIFVDVGKQPFIDVARALGAILLVWIICRLWWRARDDQPLAVHRAGTALLLVAVLSPATLPWYLSWGMALLAMVPWSRRGLTAMVFVSLMLIIVYYPNGEDALYNWPYLLGCALVAALAAVSLYRPDPLRLAAGARSGRTPAAPRPVVGERGTTAEAQTAARATEPLPAEQPPSTPDAADAGPATTAAPPTGTTTSPSPAGASAGAEQRAG
ncbi:polyprenol phosphomannose-dependent alpha 1,6 mannosyltransferase MptB [Pseudonocardia humida]|nr:polyprenol phosphomannose-dependent alpha 1,6 mannosyltransferase MptB [Pseudonocardia humida]